MLRTRNSDINSLKIKLFISSWFLFLILSLLLSCTPSKEFLLRKKKGIGIDNHKIRILIKKADKRILLSSKSRIRITEIRSRSVKYDDTGKEIYFNTENIVTPLLIESWNAPLKVDEKSYRGIIELHNILGKIYVINILDINEYLYGVVPCEIPNSWDIQALKAQAVAARTYTYYHLVKKRRSLYDLDSTINFQIYNGISVENKRSNRAVDETSGKIVVYNNKPILAFFHSTCGGETIDDKFVWDGDDKPYLNTQICKFCKASPKYKWDDTITLYEIRRALQKEYMGIEKITGIFFQRKGARVAFVIIRHKNGVLKMSGNDFRLLFPQKRIKSMYFTAEKTNNGLNLHGHGWGHGVGMCQWGAKGMADDGADYKDILKFYYKGIRIIDTKQTGYARR